MIHKMRHCWSARHYWSHWTTWDLECDSFAGECLHKDLHTNTEMKDQMKSGLLLDVIIQRSAFIFELFASEYKNLHTDTEMKDEMESGLLLDVIVQKSVVVLESFVSEYKDLHTNTEEGRDEEWALAGCYNPKECSHLWAAYRHGDKEQDEEWTPSGCYSPKECGCPWVVCQWIWKSACQCGDKGWDGEWTPSGCYSLKECGHPWVVCQQIQKSTYQCVDKGRDGEQTPFGWYSLKECGCPWVICPWKSGHFLGNRLLWIGCIASNLTCTAYPLGSGSFISGEVLISWWLRAALSNSIPHWLALISLTIHQSIICTKDRCSVSGMQPPPMFKFTTLWASHK